MAGLNEFNIIYIIRKLKCGRIDQLLSILCNKFCFMCGSVQIIYCKFKKICLRRLLFFPLVVDVIGPAQADYSLPGLFMGIVRASKSAR